jgi:hypothetical protein
MTTQRAWAHIGWANICGSLGIGCLTGWSTETATVRASGLQPNDLSQLGQTLGVKTSEEQKGNRLDLTEKSKCIYRYFGMGQPPKPEHLKRSKLFPLRLTPGEITYLKRASRKLGESVAAILRKGAVLYIQMRGKGGSQRREETR